MGGDDIAILVAVGLAKRFEGFYAYPYLCPAGIPTIGFGATYYEDGRSVTLKDAAITRERAMELLVYHVSQVYLPAVRRLCPGVTDPLVLAVLIDFAFNLGAGRLKASTLRKRANAMDRDGMRAELMKWVMAAGRKLRGLVLRREAECQLV